MATASSDTDSDSSSDYTLIHKAANFLKKDLEGMISRFVDRYAASYSGEITSREHTLEDTLLHRDFVEAFEKMLEKYIEEECPEMNKIDALQKFFQESQDTMEGRFQPLFMEDEDPNRDFVESLLSVSDYEPFFNMLSKANAKRKESISSSAGEKKSTSSPATCSSKEQHK